MEALEEIVSRSERFLKQHDDVAVATGTIALGLYSIVLSHPAEPDWGDFAIELADANPILADAIFGVRFDGDAPSTWYIDH